MRVPAPARPGEQADTGVRAPAHALDAAGTITLLGTDGRTGLTEAEATARNVHSGLNVLPTGRATSALGRFFRQFKDPLV